MSMYTNNPDEFLGNVVSTRKVDCGGNCPEVESRQPENRGMRNKDCCSPNGININFNVDSQNDISRSVENPPMVQPMVMNPNIIQPVFKTQDFTSDMDVNFPNGSVYTVKQGGTDIFPEEPLIIQKPEMFRK